MALGLAMGGLDHADQHCVDLESVALRFRSIIMDVHYCVELTIQRAREA